MINNIGNINTSYMKSMDSLSILALKSGDLNPNDWCQVILNRNRYGNRFEYDKYRMDIWNYTDDTNKQFIDSLREEYNLPSIDLHRKYFDYQSKYKINYSPPINKNFFELLPYSLVPQEQFYFIFQ